MASYNERGYGRTWSGRSRGRGYRESRRYESNETPSFALGLGVQLGESPIGSSDTRDGRHHYTQRHRDSHESYESRYRHGRGHQGYRSQSYQQEDEASGEEDEDSSRPPRHLRGRAIGMWYAARSRGRAKTKRATDEKRDRHDVQMDYKQERNLTSLLASIKSRDQIPPQPQRSYTLPETDSTRDWWDESASSSSQVSNTKHESQSNYFDGTSAVNDLQPINREHQDTSQFGPSTSGVSRIKPEAHDTLHEEWLLMCSSEIPRVEADSNDDDDSSGDEICRGAAEVVDLMGEEFSQFDAEFEDSEMAANYSQENSEEFVHLYNVKEEEEVEAESAFMYEFRKHRDENRRSLERLTDIGKVRTFSRDCALDHMLQTELRQKMQNRKYMRMLEFRRKLPSYGQKEELVQVVNSNQVIVISGETGCGKTTQVPQFILDDYIARGQGSTCRIVCTQPRRISAISVAERVADERCEPCGQGGSVGFQIRLEKKLPRSKGSMLFCTTGILLQWLASDPFLSDTTHVILDEIHERDLHSDFLMIILRDILPARPDLKVILMSATLNAHLFSQYYGNCPMLHIPGFTFHVQEFLLEDTIEMLRWRWHDPPVFRPKGGRTKQLKDKLMKQREEFLQWCNTEGKRYSPSTLTVLRGMDFEEIQLDLISGLVEHIMVHKPEGAILVFVPGWEQISKLVRSLESKPCMRPGKAMLVPLHSLMPTVNQKEVFSRPPPGVRKVVVATNIAETSITIDDVVYVIDSGKIKMKNYNAEENLATLQPEWVSMANSRQRRGRAGRVQPGECYHLYTSYHSSQLAEYQLPELLRTRLEELCLQVKLLRLGKIQPFLEKAMQPPAHAALIHSLQLLRDLNALDENEDLTPLGYHLAKMPLDPHTGKMILFSAMFCCLDPILTVAASLSYKNAFYIPMGMESVADQKRKEIAGDSRSDHMMLANAYKGWERASRQGSTWSYCKQYFLSEFTLRLLRDMRRQFATLLHEMGFIATPDCLDKASNVNSGNERIVRAVICAGLYPNVVKYRTKKNLIGKKTGRFRPGTMESKSEKKGLMFHPKSVNDKETDFSSIWFVYHLKLKSSKIFIHDATMVSPYALLFFGGAFTQKTDGGDTVLVVDEWMEFRASPTVVHLVQQLRHELDQLLEKKVTNPAPTNWDPNEPEGALLKGIIELVTTEQSFIPEEPKREKSGKKKKGEKKKIRKELKKELEKLESKSARQETLPMGEPIWKSARNEKIYSKFLESLQ